MLATQKKKKLVYSLEDDNGSTIEREDNILGLATIYFKELFSTKPMQESNGLMER